mmetsp:Transcript_8329/g.19617  ORF Transcript_8329/g.19617 Transcript_8329/m.19617 type:complete len:249 (-) Transcript_8329:2051-2797(-)
MLRSEVLLSFSEASNAPHQVLQHLLQSISLLFQSWELVICVLLLENCLQNDEAHNVLPLLVGTLCDRLLCFRSLPSFTSSLLVLLEPIAHRFCRSRCGRPGCHDQRRLPANTLLLDLNQTQPATALAAPCIDVAALKACYRVAATRHNVSDWLVDGLDMQGCRQLQTVLLAYSKLSRAVRPPGKNTASPFDHKGFQLSAFHGFEMGAAFDEEELWLGYVLCFTKQGALPPKVELVLQGDGCRMIHTQR